LFDGGSLKLEAHGITDGKKKTCTGGSNFWAFFTDSYFNLHTCRQDDRKRELSDFTVKRDIFLYHLKRLQLCSSRKISFGP